MSEDPLELICQIRGSVFWQDQSRGHWALKVSRTNGGFMASLCCSVQMSLYLKRLLRSMPRASEFCIRDDLSCCNKCTVDVLQFEAFLTALLLHRQKHRWLIAFFLVVSLSASNLNYFQIWGICKPVGPVKTNRPWLLETAWASQSGQSLLLCVQYASDSQ